MEKSTFGGSHIGSADYHFNGFLEAGGASSDLAVADYVIQDIAWSIVYNKQTGDILYYHRENYVTGYSFRLDRK